MDTKVEDKYKMFQRMLRHLLLLHRHRHRHRYPRPHRQRHRDPHHHHYLTLAEGKRLKQCFS